MTKGDLLKLAEKCEAGGGPDPDLAWEVARLTKINPGFDIAHSIDATERLRERLLPEWLLSSSQYPDGWEAAISNTNWFDAVPGKGSTEPRARLAAILRAFAATLENRDE